MRDVDSDSRVEVRVRFLTVLLFALRCRVALKICRHGWRQNMVVIIIINIVVVVVFVKDIAKGCQAESDARSTDCLD